MACSLGVGGVITWQPYAPPIIMLKAIAKISIRFKTNPLQVLTYFFNICEIPITSVKINTIIIFFKMN